MFTLAYTSFVFWITNPATPADSAHMAQLLSQLERADSTVCELAGRSLTNFGGWGRDDDNSPMPMPMPTPMPMPFSNGDVSVEIHGIARDRR